MDIFTHSFISRKVRQIVLDELGIKLSKKKLEYGSIMPDLVPKLRNIRHFKEDSIQFVLDSIEELKSTPFSFEKKKIKKFSKKLGIILHYLCDYFCFAHNNKLLIDNIYKHLLYENRINLSTVNYKHETTEIRANYDYLFCYSPIEIINEFLYEYKNKPQSNPDRDLHFAINICSVITMSIIEECIENTKIAA